MQWLFLSQTRSKDPQRRIEALTTLAAKRDERSVHEVYSLISDPVPDVRTAAVRALSQWRDERDLRALAAAVRDSEPSVREAALLGMQQLNHRGAIPIVTPLLCDASASVRAFAARALDVLGWTPDTEAHRALHFVAHGQYAKAAAMGDVALDVLLALFHDTSGSVRREVAEVLAALPQPRVATALTEALKDPDPGVRIAAIGSLGKIGDPNSGAAVIAALSDADKNVRVAAIEAVSNFRQPEHLPLLERCLKDEQWGVRAAAAIALARSGDRTVVPSLLELLKDGDPDVRTTTVEALGLVRDNAAIEGLIMAQLDPESGVRQAALKAVSRINPRWHKTEEAQRTFSTLKRALRSNDYWVRHSATELMARIFNVRQAPPLLSATSDPAAIVRSQVLDILSAALWDKDALLRGAAAEGLGRLRDRRAKEGLSERLSDANQWVRAAAAAALREIETDPAPDLAVPQTDRDSWNSAY